MSPEKWRPFCLGPNLLMQIIWGIQSEWQMFTISPLEMQLQSIMAAMELKFCMN